MPNQMDWHCIKGIEKEIWNHRCWAKWYMNTIQRFTDFLKCKMCSFESKVRICNSCNSVFCPCFPAGLNCYGSCSLPLAKRCSACKCCLFPVCTALSAVVKLWVLKRHSWPRAESWSSFFYILQFLTECLLGIFYWSSQFSLWQAQKALTLFSCSSALTWIKNRNRYEYKERINVLKYWNLCK